MAKSKKSIRKRSKLPKWLARFYSNHPAASVYIGFILLAIVGYGGWRSVATYTQYRRFQQVGKSILELESQLIAKLGQPAKISRDKSCTHASTNFGKGTLGCGISLQLVYPVNGGKQEANRLFENVVFYFMKDQSLFKISTKTIDLSELKELSQDNTSDSKSFTILHQSDMSCGFKINYVVPFSNSYQFFDLSSKENIRLDVECGETPALWAYYPVNY